jgi:branched-chain amino acid transport system ATP-binding protein
LLWDEPTEGGWTGVIEEIAARLEALAREIAVVIAEQHLELALRVAETAHVLGRRRRRSRRLRAKSAVIRGWCGI